MDKTTAGVGRYLPEIHTPVPGPKLNHPGFPGDWIT